VFIITTSSRIPATPHHIISIIHARYKAKPRTLFAPHTLPHSLTFYSVNLCTFSCQFRPKLRSLFFQICSRFEAYILSNDPFKDLTRNLQLRCPLRRLKLLTLNPLFIKVDKTSKPRYTLIFHLMLILN